MPANHPASHSHRNQQYSIIALTNGGGTITERYAYSAYGTPIFLDASGSQLATSAEGHRYTYTGREWDSSLSLYHYRARMYDSVAGRFLGRDPIRYFDGYNLSVYCGSSPINRVDPYGKSYYNPAEILLCQAKLKASMVGEVVGMDCSKALLKIAMNGHPQPGKSQCPGQCQNEDLEDAITGGCLSQHSGRGAKCNSTTTHSVKLRGKHKYENGDLYYALKNVTWEADLTCTSYCGGPKPCIGNCCGCSSICRGKITVNDRYDFCGTAYGDKYSLTNCACALERGGLITPFSVSCQKSASFGHKRTTTCSNFNDPEIGQSHDCGSTTSSDWRPWWWPM